MATLKIKLTSVETIVKQLGLEQQGKVQEYMDSTVARLSDPYVPMDTGYTKRSVFELSHFGSGTIKYNAYYTNKGKSKTIWDDDRLNFQGAPMRGNYWVFKAMIAGGYDKLVEGVGKFIKKIIGGPA
ncbi:MAG: hypothetical protein LBL20_01425 [Treponema sp.]|jgi:hypothetical protein|nr:hypothetical protein [Treponema sp.]